MKIALVTGANKGIGFEIAKETCRKEFFVFLSAHAYSIFKTALNAVKRQFAAALKSKGIAINSVHPG